MFEVCNNNICTQLEKNRRCFKWATGALQEKQKNATEEVETKRERRNNWDRFFAQMMIDVSIKHLIYFNLELSQCLQFEQDVMTS